MTADGYALPPAAPVAMRERYEWIDANDYRRVFERVGPSGTPAIAGEVCRRGDQPPAADACIVPELGPATLRHAAVAMPASARRAGDRGVVRVIVSLDRDANVVGARIESSPSAALNDAALTAARTSVYRTSIHDCRPVGGDFLFTVEFEP